MDARLAEAFTVEHTSFARAALRASEPPWPAVVICEAHGLPIDPVDVGRTIRLGRPQVPFVIACDTCAESERIKGFQFGVDDYLCGAMSGAEIRERLRLLLRRSTKVASATIPAYKGKRLVVDFEAVSISVDGRAVHLTKREFDVLRFLVENRNRLLTREDILAGVWNSIEINETRTVDIHIYKLRTKLGAAGRQIQTLVGRGYRFMDA
jgi:two-component system alkaline phosphatase synthesis response regulator PhoP